MSWVRAAARVAALVGLVLACVPLHYGWRLTGAVSPWPRRFLKGAAWVCGARVRVEETPLRRDVLFVANHLSWLDILVLGGATGCAFVSKAELQRTSLVGWLAGLNRTIYVDRSDRRALGEQIAAIRRGLEAGPVALFPEGTTSDGTMLLPFKPSLLQVAEQAPAGLRIQPLFVDYGKAAAAIAWGEEEDGARNVRRVLGRASTIPVTIHCLAPLDPGAMGDRKAMAAEARSRIVAAISASGAAIRTG